MGLRAWEAFCRCVPSPLGPTRARLRFPRLLPRLGWGLPRQASPWPSSQGTTEMSFCWLNKAALSRALISGLGEMGHHRSKQEPVGWPGWVPCKPAVAGKGCQEG